MSQTKEKGEIIQTIAKIALAESATVRSGETGLFTM
jgi:hypothetical protein